MCAVSISHLRKNVTVTKSSMNALQNGSSHMALQSCDTDWIVELIQFINVSKTGSCPIIVHSLPQRGPIHSFLDMRLCWE